MRKFLMALPIAVLTMGLGVGTASAAETAKSFSMHCITGPYKPTYAFSGFDINTPNTTMDASKIRLRTVSKNTGKDSNYKIQWSRIIFRDSGGANEWKGSVRGKNGGPRVHRAQSWNPPKVDVVTGGGPFIRQIRLQVQVDRNHVCNSPWKTVN